MTFSDAMTRVIIRAALYSLPLLLIVVSIANTPGRVTSPCMDTAGVPGRWDCDLGRRVDPPVWEAPGYGLDLPLR
jgi:hypothetical protein